jgi:exonuclease SbcC
LEPRLVDLDQRIADAKREEAELAAVPMPPAPPNTDGPRRALREAEDRWAAHTAAMAEHRAAIAAAETAAVGRADALAQCAAAEVDAADWGALATDLGRDGLQALEIDGAGPEMTAMVNDLLHTCYGPRWTVTIDASRTSADGRRQLEGCEVTVIDTVEGRTGPGETFSGGERVILGEAIALALSALAARRQGIEDVTLIRDETGAALDVDAARAYVAMLRRGAAAMGASRVFLVTHNPDIQAMADSRIVVGGGTASVMEA